MALFGADGAIARLVALEFRTMPEHKTRVVQFDIGDILCTDISRVLVNDVLTCEGEGLDPRGCLARLETASRLDIGFGL